MAHISRRIDMGGARAHEGIDDDSPISMYAGVFDEADVGAHAMGYENRVENFRFFLVGKGNACGAIFENAGFFGSFAKQKLYSLVFEQGLHPGSRTGMRRPFEDMRAATQNGWPPIPANARLRRFEGDHGGSGDEDASMGTRGKHRAQALGIFEGSKRKRIAFEKWLSPESTGDAPVAIRQTE